MSFQVSLLGRRALITGASKGLGAYFAERLAASGAHVAVASRRQDECERVCEDIRARGGQAHPVEMDVTSPQSVQNAVHTARDALSGLDILVNNAGVAQTVGLLDQSAEDWDRVLDTNLKGAFLVAQAVARIMAADKGGGAIINVASILGYGAGGQVAAYAVSKAALVHLTKSMALEWARFDIRVNALCPGYIETDMNREFFATDLGKAVVKRVPQRRIGTLHDLEGPLLFLASDASRYMTGSSLIVDGGQLVSSL